MAEKGAAEKAEAKKSAAERDTAEKAAAEKAASVRSAKKAEKSATKIPPSNFMCKKCKFECWELDEFEDHMEEHELKCEKCAYIARSKSMLTIHIDVQHGLNDNSGVELKCKVCNFTSTTEIMLKSHNFRKHNIK